VQIIWRDIVRAYTELELSYARDKLAALAGIAKKFMQIRPHDTYFAGLWKSSFIEDLLWYSTLRHRNSPTSPRPQNRSAPSRSWASINSTVGTRGSSYDRNNKYISNANSCVDVLNINCVAIRLDSTGSGGYAVLKGSIMAAPYENKPNISNFQL
ncbi:hypothetical protein F5882DRAFT_288403, partial [Hyaloscypha sp. PMI_1271]